MTMQPTSSQSVARGRLLTAYGVVHARATPHGLREIHLPRWNGIAQIASPALNGRAATQSDASEGSRNGQIEPDADPRARRHLEQGLCELHEYFAGALREFHVVLDPVGSEFLQDVWRAVAGVPYGETRSYGEIARQVGLPDAARAVGRANAINPLAPIVPCHRIVGSDGRLTGYGPGLPMKERLLRMEDALPGDAADYDAWIARVKARLGLAAAAPLYLGIRRTRAACHAGCERSRASADLPPRFFTDLVEASSAGFAPCPLCQAAASVSSQVAQPRLTFEGFAGDE